MTLPTTVVLDAGGRVSALNVGFVNDTMVRIQVEAAPATAAREVLP
ncbi:MAG: hypothetical protein ABI352_11275 [Candidatus Dormibacter sp.]